jgi:predicted DNA-binding transcriptional regulator YafY
MGKTERLYKMQRMLEQKASISTRELMDALEVSRATFRRDLDYLRDRLGVPVVWDNEAGGYSLEATDGAESSHSLPGLWLNEKEIFGLLTVIDLLSELEPESLIGDQVKPLRKRLEKLLEQDRFSVDEIRHRIRLFQIGSRQSSTQFFQVVAHALMTRKRLVLHHFSRLDGSISEREVSPQRIVYYRDNWYLDAFCHLRNDVRSFSIDALESALESDKPAVSVSERVLHDELESGYGIFAGKKSDTALLKFTPFRARWVSKEIWHPDQKGKFLPDGSYLMHVPYSDDRELIHDILRQGKDVEVLEPKELRAKIEAELDEMFKLYRESKEP